MSAEELDAQWRQFRAAEAEEEASPANAASSPEDTTGNGRRLERTVLPKKGSGPSRAQALVGASADVESLAESENEAEAKPDEPAAKAAEATGDEKSATPEDGKAGLATTFLQTMFSPYDALWLLLAVVSAFRIGGRGFTPGDSE